MATADLTFSLDNFLDSSLPNTNWDTYNQIWVGEVSGATLTTRTIIKPNYSTIPAGQVITAATLKMIPVDDKSTNARTMYAHRILRTVVAGQSTWNNYSTGNAWGTAGCSNSSTDYDGAVVLGSATQPAAPTLSNPAFPFTMDLSATEMQKFYDGTYTNNGIILFVNTQVNDCIYYASTQHATSTYRPVITVTYEPIAGTGGGFFLFF